MASRDELNSAFHAEDDADVLFENFVVDDDFKTRTKRREPEVIEKEVIVEVVPDNALVPGEGDVIETKGYKITPTGLRKYDNATFEDWLTIGETLLRIDRGIQFALGDWILDGEMSYGMTNDKVAKAVGRDIHTIENYIWVARSVISSLRKEELFFGHHALVAAMETDDEKRYWLDLAVEKKMSVEQLRLAIVADKKGPALPDPEDPFGARHFSKNARTVAGVVERVSGEGNVSRKKAQEALDQIDQMKQWLRAAESIVKKKMR